MKSTKAVALKYEEGYRAPKIVAKGYHEIAQIILKIAREHGIPVEEDEYLCKALMQFEVGDYIPEELYEIVAQLLAFVYSLKLGEHDGNEKDQCQGT
jgi:flagellar biosynthesis protein